MNQLLGTKTKRSSRKTGRQSLLQQEFGHLMAHIAQDVKTESGTPTIGFCASKSGEGCSSIAANYAVLCGQEGIRTTLIEANLRRPSLAKMFDVPSQRNGAVDGPGLAEILDGTASVEEATHLQVSKGVNLIAAGNPPSEIMVAGDRFDLSPLFEALYETNDLLIVDVPNLTFAPESGIILPQLDGAILVLEANRSRVCGVQRTVRRLNQLGVNLIGSVLNKMQYELPPFMDKLL